MDTNTIEVKSKDELEITKEIKSSWTREQLLEDIDILEKQIIEFQNEIEEKKALLVQLDNFK